jgi:ABC-type nitrate/sulfonate/bicarbonate transport system substrate-binding protein
MYKTRLGALILVLALMTACAAPASSPGPASSATAPLKSGTMRVSNAGNFDVRDLPALMAYDALREQGYTVEVIPFAKTSLMPAALDKGDIDITEATASLVWASIIQGADVRTIVGKVNMTFRFVSTADIDDCSKLDGKAITFSNRTSVSYLMFKQYVARNCPGITLEEILIAESANRVAALQAGQAVGANLDLEESLLLQQSTPGKYRVLMDFAREFPAILLTPYSVRREWAEQNRTMVLDFVRELLLANRQVMRDPQVLREGIVKYLDYDEAQAAYLADAYLAAAIWDANGGLTPENIENTLEFLHDGGMLTVELKLEDVADLTYLNAVLDELGRQ